MGQNLHNIGIDNKDKLIRLQEVFVIESEVDPKTYILGPGDKIGLSIITSSTLAYTLTITPTGDLWIPDIGDVHISGFSIPDAEKEVHTFIENNRFKSSDVTIVLINIRRFKIQVIGAVNSPGFVIVSTIERLSDAIEKSGGLHKLADEENLSLIRSDNSEIICSLKSYQFNGDLVNNPILKQGDVIRIAYNSEYSEELKASITHKQSLVFVTGFVLRPAGHKFIPGYSVNDYIAMSGGVTDLGSMKNLGIYRNGEGLSTNGIIILKPSDQIDIPANLKYRMLGNMSILQTITAMMTLYLTYQAAVN